MKKKLFTVWVFTKIASKRFFRDKIAIFFTVVFPLVFLFIFGGLFGKSNNVSFKVAVLDQSNTPYSNQVMKLIKASDANQEGLSKEEAKKRLFKVDSEITDLTHAKEKMNRSELDATIVVPKEFGQTGQDQKPHGELQVLYSQNSQQAGQALGAVLSEMVKGLNKQMGASGDVFTVKTTQTNDRGLSSFDYVFSGLLGFSILGLGIFGPMNVFPELKKQGILRRFHTTTLRVWQYFMATMFSQSFIALVSFAVQFAVAFTVFKLKLVGNPFELILFLLLSTITILGIGLALGGWAKNERQAAPVGQLVTLPMMFLSGTFFPRFLMPEWLQKVSAFIPLTPIVDGIRLIATEGKHLTQIGPQLGLVAAWCVIIYIIAFRVFRWE